jgi:hypothetical protein
MIDARLAIRSGDHERAYKALRKTVRKGRASTQALLLFAIAARATGHDDDFEAALAVARDKGADVEILSPERG